MTRLAELAELALSVAELAGARALAGFRSSLTVEHKKRRDLVTEIDRAAEAVVVEALRSAEPDIAIVAEEGGRHGDDGELCWYVDPLDGTTNFVHGHPVWCVSIGLASRGQPVAGAVVAPVIGLSWHGHAGGVFRSGEACAVSATAALPDALIATGFPAALEQSADPNFRCFEAVERRCQGVRRCGSAAFELCLVADGSYDGFWERKLSPWDIAAGAALVRAAGGTVSGLGGRALDLERGDVVATNGRIHEELLKALK